MEIIYFFAAIYLIFVVPYKLWKSEAVNGDLQNRIIELERYNEIYITEINNYKRKIDELYSVVDQAKQSASFYSELYIEESEKLDRIDELIEEHWKDDVKLYGEIRDIINGDEDEEA